MELIKWNLINRTFHLEPIHLKLFNMELII